MSEVWVRLDELNNIPAGTVRQFAVDFRRAWLVRAGETLRAFYSTCTHMGGPVSPKGERFECHFHGATFDRTTGRALSGPAPTDSCLPEVSLKVEDGIVYFLRIRND